MDMLVGRILFLAGCWPEASPIPCHMSLSSPQGAPRVVTRIPQSGRESERRRGSQRPQSLRGLVSGVTSQTFYCFLCMRTFLKSWPTTVTSAEKFEVNPSNFMQWLKGGFGQKYVFDSWERGKKGEGGSLRDSRLTVRSRDTLNKLLCGSSQIAKCSRPGWPFTQRCDEASVLVLGVSWGPGSHGALHALSALAVSQEGITRSVRGSFEFWFTNLGDREK